METDAPGEAPNKADKVPFILGQSHIDVINTMQMLDKWSKILITNHTLGGPRYLPAHESNRIEERLDEAYRRKRILESSE